MKHDSNKSMALVQGMSDLVIATSGEVVTTSLIVAEKFNKRHDNVMQAISRIECSPGFSRLNFQERDYVDERGKSQPMYEITRDGFVFLAMGFTGKQAATWKESFISAFNAMERQLLKQAQMQATVDWQAARLAGKVDRNALTDAVQRLALRAHDRQESTTPVSTFEMSATRVITGLLFDLSGERVKAVRDRLTAKQLSRLAIAEEIYANKVLSLLGADISHKSINLEAKQALVSFVASIGGKQVPGIDRLPMLAVTGEVAA
jgi:Rha family phage regulatory protein